MKTIILLVFFPVMSLCTIAQNSNAKTDFQKKEFNSEINKDTIEYFTIKPLLKNDTSVFTLKDEPKLPDNYDSESYRSTNPFITEDNTVELRMPVAGGSPGFNMPVMVPDSCVHFYIKEKRIKYVNPCEKKFK